MGQLEVDETVKAMSKLGIALSKVPAGLVQVFKDACIFCEAHMGMVDHPSKTKGSSMTTAAPDGMQATVCKGGAASHNRDPSLMGMGSKHQGKLSTKLIIEVHDAHSLQGAVVLMLVDPHQGSTCKGDIGSYILLPRCCEVGRWWY